MNQTRNRFPFITASELTCAFCGAIGACLVLSAWFLAAWYAMFFFAFVIYKSTRS